MTKGIALTALGMVNALGQETETIWRRLTSGDQSGLTLQEGYLKDRPARVGRVEGVLPAVPDFLKRYDCRNNALALAAFRQIEMPVRVLVDKYGAARIGVVMGSSTAGIASTESAFAAWRDTRQLPASFDYVQHEMGGLAEFVALLSGAEGPAYAISTACSSSAKVFASARALLRQDLCDAVIVGGADSLCRLTVQGFAALEALSEKPCNSLSRNRDGFNVGEGAAVFLMEREKPGVQLLGVGESSDAHHVSAPDPEGHGAHAAMRAALTDAGLEPGDVSYVHLHGTGTPLNDAMESRAIASLFVDVPVSSSKGMIGHTLGASGAMGVGFCWLSLMHRQKEIFLLPPHVWDGDVDETLPRLSIVTKGQTLAGDGAVFLSNSFGFGGSNASVLLGVPR